MNKANTDFNQGPMCQLNSEVVRSEYLCQLDNKVVRFISAKIE